MPNEYQPTHLVALEMLWQGRVGHEHRKRGHALVHVVEETGNFVEELLAHVVAVQASGSGEDRQLGQSLQQVVLALWERSKERSRERCARRVAMYTAVVNGDPKTEQLYDEGTMYVVQ